MFSFSLHVSGITPLLLPFFFLLYILLLIGVFYFIFFILSSVYCSWIIILFTAIAVIIVFDPLGHKKALYYVDKADHNLESSQSQQLLYSVKKAATRVWETRIRLLCCCIGSNNDNRVAFSSIAELLTTYFSVREIYKTFVIPIRACSYHSAVL